MTSPETPSQEPQRSIFGVSSWKAVVPMATVLTFFVIFMLGILGWFDNRIDGVERRLTARIVEVKVDLSNRIVEVKTDLTDRIDQVETGLNARIDRVEKRLIDRIDRVETDLGIRIDEVKAELAAGEARRAAVDAQLSADIEQVAAGVAENRAAHRELAGFVRASRSQEPPPASDPPGPAPAQ